MTTTQSIMSAVDQMTANEKLVVAAIASAVLNTQKSGSAKKDKKRKEGSKRDSKK